MWTAILATLNLLDGTDYDVWSVNTEAEYHEEGEAVEGTLDLDVSFREAPRSSARQPLARPAQQAPAHVRRERGRRGRDPHEVMERVQRDPDRCDVTAAPPQQERVERAVERDERAG